MNKLGDVKTNGKVITLVLAGVVLSNLITYSLAHGGDINLIHSCVNKDGNVRIIGANDTCKQNETALDWNKEGMQGPPGPAGGNSGLPFICPNCQLNGAGSSDEIFGSRLKNRDLTDAYMIQTHINGGDFSGTKFIRADLTNSAITNDQSMPNFSHTDFTDALLSFSSIVGVNFANSNFTNTKFINTTIQNTDFTGSVMTGANFSGTSWNSTICPDGTNSDNNGNTCIGHL